MGPPPGRGLAVSGPVKAQGGSDGTDPASAHCWAAGPGLALAAALSLVLLLLCNYLVVITARVHGRIARALLGPPIDPLAAAKQMLANPGPLA
jgi:hypothetical protein